MARPEGEDGPDRGADDVVRPGTGVVRPGSTSGAAGTAGVVRPGTAVVRPGTDVVRPDTAPDGAAKAVAAVPEAPPDKPLEPIHVVLPVIHVKPAKQGFLDRLVAGKTDAEKAEEAARKDEEARRKAEETQRRAEDKARREQEEAEHKAAEKARREARDSRREALDAERKARAEAAERARKQAEKARREQEKARREQERALRRAGGEEPEDEVDEEPEEYDEPARSPAAPSRPAPPGAPSRTAPAPPRPGPSGPGPGAPPRPSARPAPAPLRGPGRGRAPQRVDRYDDYEAPEGRRRRPLWHWVVAAVALVALGGGSAVVATVVAPPGTVSYQTGIDTGHDAPVLGGLDTGAPVPSRSGLEEALAPLIATPNLGPSPAVTVADAVTGQALWNRQGDAPMKPASSAKVLTAAAVLATRGPNYRIPTRVVAGSSPGEVVLVAGGDPTLAVGDVAYFRGAGRLDELAQQVRGALGSAAPSRVLIDGSLFSGPTVGPSGSGNVGGVVANVTALMIDGARTNPTYRGDNPQYYSQPDVAAGQAFARALGLPASQVGSGSAPANARVLGEVMSPPIATIVEQMLAESDNTVAEMMARQVAIAKNMPATFAGGAQASRQALADLGLPMPAGTGLHDGSGLSHDNRVTTNHLTAILLKAASPDSPELRPILSGLAVAGYSGTMDDDHNRGRAGRGTTRAKTGTLAGVNALIGYLVDADGRLLAFAAIGNDTPNRFVAEPALDRIAERLTHCGCR